MTTNEIISILRETTGPVYVRLRTGPGQDPLNVRLVRQSLLDNLQYYARVNGDVDMGWEVIKRPNLTVLRQP